MSARRELWSFPRKALAVAVVTALSASAAAQGLPRAPAGGVASDGFAIAGVDGVDYSGVAVSGAGDVNGDGIDDLLIGAWGANPGGVDRPGASYVVFGRDTGFPTVFGLALLMPENGGDGSAGFVMPGVGNFDRLGRAVSGAGDVNGDGVHDLLVGALRASPDGMMNAGASYVVFGRTTGFPALVDLADLLPENGGDGSEGFVLEGIDAQDSSGRSVSNAGDVNGDGLDDLIIGAIDADVGNRAYAGESYVVFGRTTGFPARFELADLLSVNGGDGSQGFVLEGARIGDRSGLVHAAGDVNGDGLDDLIIGAWRADPAGLENAGEAYVVFGRDTGFPAEFALSSLFPVRGGDGSQGFVLAGFKALGQVGIVGSAGDFNGDGFDDVITGAWRADAGVRTAAGESYVVFGRGTGFPAVFELSSLLPDNGGDGSEGVVLEGIDAFDRSGIVSGAGDVNHDGVDDVIIGAFQADPQLRDLAGEAYLVFGRASGFAAVLELSSLFPAQGGDGSEGVIIQGIDAEDRAARAVSEAGDVNGDGIDDVVIGAWRATPGNRTLAGESYVIFGRSDGFPATFPLGSLLELSVRVTGTCPGSLDLVMEGLTPFGRYNLLGAPAEGNTPVPIGPCAGTESGLNQTQLRASGNALGNGKVESSLEVDVTLCGTFLQLLDAATCDLSAVVAIPSTGAGIVWR